MHSNVAGSTEYSDDLRAGRRVCVCESDDCKDRNTDLNAQNCDDIFS